MEAVKYIIWKGEKYSIEPGESILDALKNHGIYLPASCRLGICNTCSCVITKGEVIHTSPLNIKVVVEANTVLTCIAYPLTNEVELEEE